MHRQWSWAQPTAFVERSRNIGTMSSHPIAIVAAEVPPRATRSNYPEPFASAMEKRVKRPLGEPFGLRAFGVNLT
jgi:hypothetical protein